MANTGALYGLSKDCKAKADRKFSASQALEVVQWIEAVLERKLHPELPSVRSEREFAAIFRDGTALCDLMNAISPGAIKRIHKQGSSFKQMENLEMFTQACVVYGLQPMDVFQIADLYDVKSTYTVYNCLHALGSMARKNGFDGPSFGVKVSDKRKCIFSASQLSDSRRIIPMQAGTNLVPSQKGMSPYGFSRQIVPTDKETCDVHPASGRVISLQYGTNSKASQKGMTPYGLTRQIVSSSSSPFDEARDLPSNSNADLQPCGQYEIAEQTTHADGDSELLLNYNDHVTAVGSDF